MSAKTKGDILAEQIDWILGTPNSEPYHSRIKRALDEYRKPWTLGRSVNGFTLGDGQEWCGENWTEQDLPSGFRPALIGEDYIAMVDDIEMSDWEPCNHSGMVYYPLAKIRTKRPLPTVAKLVPLGPEDVPPGSVIRKIKDGVALWTIVASISVDGVKTDRESFGSWLKLQSEYEISRDGGKTWQRCEKEAK